MTEPSILKDGRGDSFVSKEDKQQPTGKTATESFSAVATAVPEMPKRAKREPIWRKHRFP